MMRGESSLRDNMIDRNWVLKRKRKRLTSGLGPLKGKEGESLPSEPFQIKASSKKQKGDNGTSKFADKVKGNDGYYFECVECDIGGNLLCCDSCPRTYHLECLNPPLKRTPPGKWHCPHCCKPKDNAKSLANVESNTRRPGTKNMIEKQKASLRGPVFEKSSLFAKSSFSGNKKGKSSRRTATGNNSVVHASSTDSPKSSNSDYDDSSEDILAVEDDKIEKLTDISMHIKQNSGKDAQYLVEVLNSSIKDKSLEDKSNLDKRKVQGKKLSSSFPLSTEKSSKQEVKLKKANYKKDSNEEAILKKKKKKRSRTEKRKDIAVVCGDSLKEASPCRETSKSNQKSKGEKHNFVSNVEFEKLNSTSQERPQISPEWLNPSPKGMEEQGKQKSKTKKHYENSWNALQQVDRILGCRVRRSNIMYDETINSPICLEQLNSETSPGKLSSKLHEDGLDITENHIKLVVESCSGSKVGMKCDSSSKAGGVIEQVQIMEKRAVCDDCIIRSPENKQVTDNVKVAMLVTEPSQGCCSSKRSILNDKSLSSESIATQEVNSNDGADAELRAQNQGDSCLPGPSQFNMSCHAKDTRKILETGNNAEDATEKLKILAAKEDCVIYEYLVKWVGLSNIHNSWVPESQLKVLAKRKLENYKAKYGNAVINICQDNWKVPQRIITQRISDDGVEEALVKWCGLPYDECTWERLDEPAMKTSVKLLDDLRRFETEAFAKDARNYGEWTKGDSQDVLTLVEQPKELNGGDLFPHQLEALNWLRKCWLKSKNVILADEMGLGKTVSACAFISSLYSEFRVKLPCLVLVPLSTMPNWMAEFASWAPHLNVVEYHGCAKARSIIRRYEWHASGPIGSDATSKAYKFNVLLTTYEMVLADPSHLCSVPWEVLIVDEGHRLKNSGSKLFTLLNTFSFQHRVLLTGTPLQNNIGEMYNLLNFLQPVSFPSLTAFEEKFSDLTTAEKIDELKKLVAPHMLRRLKKDAMQNIPPKTERMVPVELSSIQAEYYRAMLTKNYQMLRNVGKGGNHQSMLNIVMQLRKVCNHPYLIPGTEPESGSVEFLQEMRIKASAKLTVLHSMLKILHKGGHRVLIFSQMTKLLDILEDYLTIEFGPKTFERVDGSVSVSDRQAAIARFNQDKSRFVFLLSTRSCGLGINLATADTVIIYDSDFNPHADIQAMNRAHRIGQSKRLLVYRLVVRASVEERILQLAKKKLMLDQLFVNKSGSQKEVEDILRWGTEELFNSSDTVNGQDPKETSTIKSDTVADEHRHRRRTGGLGDVYKDKCADGSTKIVWDDTAIQKLLDRSNLQSALDNTEMMDLENDMLGSVKSVEWNEELNEEPGGTVLPPNVDGYVCELASEIKEETVVNGTEENEWDKLLRVRWERYQVEEEAALGRGKRLRKAVSYRETFASIPSEASSESGNEEEEPQRDYTPTGRAFKEKFAKLRARQKERIARRHIDGVPQSDETVYPIPPPVQPVQEMEGWVNGHYEETSEKFVHETIEKNLSENLDASYRNESSGRVGKLSRQGYRRCHTDHLDLLVRTPGNFSPDIHLPCHQGANSSYPIPSSNLLPVLGLCAPNANQVNLSRNCRTQPRIPVLKNEQRRISIGKEESTYPAAATSRSCYDLNLEGKERYADPSFLPDPLGDSLHLGLQNSVPFPFCPPSSVSSRRAIFDVHETSGTSFSSFQEKFGLPNLMLDDQSMPKFPLSSIKPQAELLPSLSLSTNMDYMNGSVKDFQNMQMFPDFRQQPSDALKQKQQMTEFPSFLGLGSMQETHVPLPENHKKVLDNIIMRTQAATNKFFKKRLKIDAWSEEELDALWIGVRRHGRGNWDAMLKDPKLKFSKHRTIEDLSLRWIEEQRKIMDLPVPTAPKSSKHPPLPGISEDMMTRALLGSKFATLGNEPPKLRSHLTDIQLGCIDISSSFPPIDPFNRFSKVDSSFPQIPAWQPEKQVSCNGNLPSGPFDRQVKISSPLDQPFQHSLTQRSTFASLDINCPISCGLQQNYDVFRGNQNIQLPSASDRSLHGLHSNLLDKESQMEVPLGPHKRQMVRSFVSADDIIDNSSKTNNLPHWLRQAVSVPPPKPPEPELPPTVSAIAQSVSLIYGEQKSIPPFSVPGPPPLQPKDPRRSFKKRRKLHKLKQVAPELGCSRMKYDLSASSSIPDVPTAGSALDLSSAQENQPYLNLNLNSPSSSVDGKISTLALQRPPETRHLVASSSLDIPGPSRRIPESAEKKSLEIDENNEKDLAQDVNKGYDKEIRITFQQIDEAESGESSKTHSDPDPDRGSCLKTKEISSEDTVSDGPSEHEH